MPFDYYDNLSARQQVTYRKRDRVTEIALRDAPRLAALADRVGVALETDKPGPVQQAVTALNDGLVSSLGVAPVSVKVLARRPNRAGEELHGLYEREEGRRPLITVWMRTAKQRRTVTFRTFLRTYLHELCHHLDYELLGLADTFHTEGFFKRESSLVRALAPTRSKRPAETAPGPVPPPAPAEDEEDSDPAQLDLDL